MAGLDTATNLRHPLKLDRHVHHVYHPHVWLQSRSRRIKDADSNMAKPIPRSNFTIRGMDPDFWKVVKAKAAIDGLTLQALMEQLLATYIADGIKLPKLTKKEARA